MFESLQQIFNRFGMDAGRTASVLAIVYGLNSIENYVELGVNFAFLTSVFSSTSIILLIALFSHMIRRILFPDLDLASVAAKALETPTGSSVVFASVCIVIAVLIYVNGHLLS